MPFFSDLDDRPSHHFADRVATIHQMKCSQRPIKGFVQDFDLFWRELAVPEQAVDRHPPPPSAQPQIAAY